MPKNNLLLFLLLLVATVSLSQDAGYLQFVGHNFFNDKGLLNTDVKVLIAGKSYTTVSTGNSKDFKLILPFGTTYNIYFYNRRTQPMYLQVLAGDVPQSKHNLVATYELRIPFFPKDSRNLDTVLFREPFHKIRFNGRSTFVDDTVYMHDFLRRVYIKTLPDTAAPAVTIQPQIGTLVGQLFYDTMDKTPVQNRTVVLETKDGREITAAKTTQNGTFVFQYARLEEAYRVRVKFDEADVPVNQKLILKNSNHETVETSLVMASKQAAFEQTPQNNLVRKLVDDVFTYKIAGKLASTDGSTSKLITDKYVYLLNDKNTLVQKVRTNALGVFLFTSIKPNQHYSIAVDEKDCELPANCKLVLFNTKDKKLRVIDSISQNKFLYKFLAVSNTEFNNLLIDDIDLKMNVKGKVYGNNTSNPIGDMKVMLLNDHYETIDTAITAKNGSFTFKRVPYNRQLIISADNTNNILDVFNNIMVYDNNDNLIKIVTLIKGGKFSYKPLSTEQSRISELYVDDPWLGMVDKKYKDADLKDKVIVENILFDFNKADILPQASQTLDKVAMAMQLNPGITIELGAHTDSKGSDAYNLKLSQSRAANARQYLVQKGISENRITAIGYGETRLLNHCDNKTTCPEEEHAANRRLEFRLKSQ